MPKLSEIMGIGPKHQAKLKKANVDTVETLLKKAATPKGFAELRSVSGVKPDQLRGWTHRADLLRIRGIGSGYSDLLVKAGVRNVGKLASFEPAKLHESLARKNSALGGPVSRIPGPDVLKTWVSQARMLAASEPAGPGGGRPSRSGPAGPGDPPPE